MSNKKRLGVDESLVDGHVDGQADVGPANVEGHASGYLGRLRVGAEIDPERGAAAAVEAVSGGVSAGGSVRVPSIGEMHGDAHAEGPSANARASAGRDGLEATAGASAGNAGVDGGVDVLGQHYEGGISVGANVQVGLKIGPTTRIDLPFISLEAPNPSLGAATTLIDAGEKIVTDPVGTVKDVGSSILDRAKDAAHLFGLGGSDEPDDHAVMNDDWGRPIRPGPKGSKPID
jgi:hypothetical protein